MADAPELEPFDEIRIGKTKAVVIEVRRNEDDAFENVHVVYLNHDKAIHEDAIWVDDRWDFELKGAVGGYADNRWDLRDFVAKLRES